MDHRRIFALADEYDMLPRDGVILCALSGGADSMYLLECLRRLRTVRPLTLHAAHYNHHLRGAESHRDEAFVRDWCERAGIPLVCGGGDVAARARADGTGLEETARTLRYAFLEETAQHLGAHRIATAHNADDNAETLLLHLVRGTGLRGLTGIPPRRGPIVRPLLTTGRGEIEAAVAAWGLPFVEDSSNGDVAFARNRLRHTVLPVLRELNPSFTDTVAATVRSLRIDHDYLSAQAYRAAAAARWAEDDLVIETRYIADQPNAVAPRVVRRLVEEMGFSCGGAHLAAVVELARGADPSALVYLPDGLLVQRVYDDMLFTTEGEALPPLVSVPLNREGVTPLPGSGWTAVCTGAAAPEQPPRDPCRFYLASAALQGAPVFRSRLPGDSVALPGRDTKTVKKLFIEGKVPRRVRPTVPILADEGGLLAVAGFGPHKGRLAKPGEDALYITLQREDIQ